MRKLPIFSLLFLTQPLWVLGCNGALPVEIVTPLRRTVEATVSSVTSGTVRTERVSELAFGTVGRVKKVSVRLGDSVKEGMLLAELENTDLRLALKTVQAELERQEQLLRAKVISPAEIERARSEVQAAQGIFEKSQIIAPFDGFIAEVNLEVGQLSQITAVLPRAPLRIVDTSPRFVRAEIDEVDLSQISPGQKARVTILAARATPFLGTVRKIVPYVSSVREQDRTSEVEITVESEGTLLPVGASADVEIIVAAHEKVLAVPTRALFGRPGERYLYTVNNGGTLERTPVEVGLLHYEFSEVKEIPETLRIALPSDLGELTPGAQVIPLHNDG
jgi:HlyD family secretion protein